MKRPLFLAVAIMLSALMAGVARAGDNVQFDYQGRMLINGAPFTGSGSIKAAIVNTTGTVTLWSNDGTSLGGGQPSGSVPVTATNGVFDLTLGDAALGMQPIKAVLFNDRNDLRLRVWFSDGVNGFQLLVPDRPIPNARSFALREATENLTLYVDAASGNDAYSGLAPNQAKKTIQAAVNMSPKEVRSGTVKISVASGTYREMVVLYGIHASALGAFILQGDAGTTASATISPAVRITGADSDATHTPLRGYAVLATGSSNLQIAGILADYCINEGFHAEGSYLYLSNCSARSNAGGYWFLRDNSVILHNCWAVSNLSTGIQVESTNGVILDRCGAKSNAGSGVYATGGTSLQFTATGEYSQNGGDGIRLYGNSGAAFVGAYAGTIANNSGFGVRIRYQSNVLNLVANSITGNISGSSEIAFGSASY